MNTYRIEFHARCPVNNARIRYSLRIVAEEMIRVESLNDFVEGISSGFHEDIADALHSKFGGRQTLVAEHHGVLIETERPWLSATH